MSEEAKPEAKEAAPKKGKGKLLIIVGLVVVLAAGGGVAAKMLLGGHKETAAAAGEHGAPAAAEHGGGEAASSGHGAPAVEHGGEALISLDTFVVNLADARGDRFLKLSMRAVTGDSSLDKKLGESELLKSRVRDRVLSVLSAKTHEEISNPIGKEALRRELAQELNGVLGAGAVIEILFTDFIVQ